MVDGDGGLQVPHLVMPPTRQPLIGESDDTVRVDIDLVFCVHFGKMLNFKYQMHAITVVTREVHCRYQKLRACDIDTCMYI